MQINSHLNAFHVLCTKPSLSVGKNFSMIEAEVFVMIISALMWQKYNGRIKLYTDRSGMEFIENHGLCDIWDGGIDIGILENNLYPINQHTFWAAGKLLALEANDCPCVMLDNDLIVMHSITDELSKTEITALHSEPLNPEVYINPAFLKKPHGYFFPSFYNWNALPSNTAFLFIKDKSFKKFYLEESKHFMFNNFSTPMENITQMVFAEQRLLSICAFSKNKKINYLLQSPFSEINNTIIHLWGFKELLRNHKTVNQYFMKKLYERFNSELNENSQFNKYIFNHTHLRATCHNLMTQNS